MGVRRLLSQPMTPTLVVFVRTKLFDYGKIPFPFEIGVNSIKDILTNEAYFLARFFSASVDWDGLRTITICVSGPFCSTVESILTHFPPFLFCRISNSRCGQAYQRGAILNFPTEDTVSGFFEEKRIFGVVRRMRTTQNVAQPLSKQKSSMVL